MPRLRKIVLHNKIYFVTLSVEEGIMLPANPLVKFILESALARAYQHYNLEICHFIVNGTHIHMVVRVDNPEDLPKFMERFKTESAHYLNRLLGRKKRTVWCERYDSPILLTVADVIDTVVYLYTNPVKDGLVGSIEQYPGLSSWNSYKHEKSENLIIKSKLITRNSIFKVDHGAGYRYFQKIRNILNKASKETVSLRLSPNGWVKSFPLFIDSVKKINEEIFEKIKEKQDLITTERSKENKSYIGRVKLENQGIDLTYVSQRSGRKMWTKSSDKERKIDYISFARSLCEQGKRVFKKISNGDFSENYPFGLFPPRIPVLGNLVGCEF